MAGFNGEVIHAGAFRYRVTGEGQLKTTLYSLSDVKSKVCAEIPMLEETDIEPTKPTNFNSQRIALMFSVTAFGEWFNLSKIVLFVKPVATGWPGSSN